jgi:hypothetical protein
MSALELEVYEIFKKHFSAQEAAKIMELFETKAKKIVQNSFLIRDDKTVSTKMNLDRKY